MASRVGVIGVAQDKGDVLVIDENGRLQRVVVGADGEVFIADSTDPLGVRWGASAVPLLAWGNNAVGATTTTRYMSPWWSDTLAETSPTQYRLRRPGILTNARVRQQNPNGNGAPIVYTLRLNGVATALSISMLSTDTDSVVDASLVAAAAEDLVDIEVTKANGVGTSPTNITFLCEYRAP